ncbi:helix-turn-helix transcriptional regulator [Micromonospora maritima]|uniref:helix-turn-helix transcriptional regulator n=1 Tax=Micromonospora maritima TaxID=986711 RepID=UPI00157D5855|nr:helix-turn-helix domain-containing protein [Micromonospora maritima]
MTLRSIGEAARAAALDEYLTTEEVARVTRTSPSTVRYWRHIGKGPRGVKRGRRVLYPASAVAAWLADSGDEQGVPTDAA